MDTKKHGSTDTTGLTPELYWLKYHAPEEMKRNLTKEERMALGLEKDIALRIYGGYTNGRTNNQNRSYGKATFMLKSNRDSSQDSESQPSILMKSFQEGQSNVQLILENALEQGNLIA